MAGCDRRSFPYEEEDIGLLLYSCILLGLAPGQNIVFVVAYRVHTNRFYPEQNLEIQHHVDD